MKTQKEKSIDINTPADWLEDCKLIPEKITPTIIRLLNGESMIINLSDKFIVNGFYIKTNDSNVITTVYLKDCWHPNAVYFPFEFHDQDLLQNNNSFIRPPNILRFCVPMPLCYNNNNIYNEENIQKLIRGIQVWNLNSAYWRNVGVGLLETKRKVYPVEDEKCRIENLKSNFQKIYELNKNDDIEIYFNSYESYKDSCDGFLIRKLLKGNIIDYSWAATWFNEIVPTFNIYKIHKIYEGRIELIHTITGVSSLMLQGKKDGEK